MIITRTSLHEKLLSDIGAETHLVSGDTAAAVDYLIRHGWITNPGEKIKAADIRRGDKIRSTWKQDDDVYTCEYTAQTDFHERPINASTFFLLDRPEAEWPTEPGSVVSAREVESGVSHTLMLGRDKRWRTSSGWTPAQSVRENYVLVKVLA